MSWMVWLMRICLLLDGLRDVIYCRIFVSYAGWGLPLPNGLRLRLWIRSTLGVVISRLGRSLDQKVKARSSAKGKLSAILEGYGRRTTVFIADRRFGDSGHFSRGNRGSHHGTITKKAPNVTKDIPGFYEIYFTF